MARKAFLARGAMLTSSAQRWLKALHLVFAGLWLGGLGSIALLLHLGSIEPARAELFIAAHAVHDTLVFAAFSGTLATGLCFSLFTRWGFFTHDWISAKWALSLLLFTLTLAFQAPSLAALAGLSDAGVVELHGHSLDAIRARSATLATTQLATVGIVFLLSTLKPGRRRSPPAFNRKALLWLIGVPLVLAVAFGLFNHQQLERYRRMPVPVLTPAALSDGRYTGDADCGVPYQAEVVVHGGRITEARATRSLDNRYAHIAEAVLLRLEREQTTDVDVITGATTTSKCLLVAAADALARGAGAD